MAWRIGLALSIGAILTACMLRTVRACCPAAPSGKPVVNADQTVIILWDAARRTQHFIRKASFKSDADDFGFIVPSPTEPELEEAGGDAFPYLRKLTEPAVRWSLRPISIGCSAAGLHTWSAAPATDTVKVLQKKEVAGFDAVVLQSTSSQALVAWLKKHGYVYSPEVATWAKPYVQAGWTFTALKIAKNARNRDKTVSAGALRISFKTDRPLFPYREPDPSADAQALGARKRLLRIYFLAEARYRGELTKEREWTGQVVWADKLTSHSRRELLELLRLPKNTGPATWWLTEFEDWWPYEAAPADVYFSPDPNQQTVYREPIIRYVVSIWPRDASVVALAVALLLPPLIRRIRPKRAGR